MVEERERQLGGQGGRWVRWCLVLVAVMGLGMAWGLYPAENRFSVMRCTISFLGSPDANRNPDGWRFYQVGMTALALVLFSLMWERHGKLRARVGRVAMGSSVALGMSLVLLLVVTWIPDSREIRVFGQAATVVHTRLAILAIPILGLGVLVDGVALWWSGVRVAALWPFTLYGALFVVGLYELVTWEQMCRRDPSLPHWPGEGLHSTPFWEWTLFTYFVGWTVWMARGRAWAAGAHRRGMRCEDAEKGR